MLSFPVSSVLQQQKDIRVIQDKSDEAKHNIWEDGEESEWKEALVLCPRASHSREQSSLSPARLIFVTRVFPACLLFPFLWFSKMFDTLETHREELFMFWNRHRFTSPCVVRIESFKGVPSCISFCFLHQDFYVSCINHLLLEAVSCFYWRRN